MAHSGSRDCISLVPGLGHEARTVVCVHNNVQVHCVLVQ